MAVGPEHLWVFALPTETLRQQLVLLHKDASHHARRLLEEVQEELAARECNEAIRQLLSEEEAFEQQDAELVGGLESYSSSTHDGIGSLCCTSGSQHERPAVQCLPCAELQQQEQETLHGQAKQGDSAMSQLSQPLLPHSEQKQPAPSCTEQSSGCQLAVAHQWPRLTPVQAAQLAFREEQANIRRARQAVVRRPQVHGRPVVKQLSCQAAHTAGKQSWHCQPSRHTQRRSLAQPDQGTETGPRSAQQLQPKTGSELVCKEPPLQQQECICDAVQQNKRQLCSVQHHQQLHGVQDVDGLQGSAGVAESHVSSSSCVCVQQQKLGQLEQLAHLHHQQALIATSTNPAAPAQRQTDGQPAEHAAVQPALVATVPAKGEGTGTALTAPVVAFVDKPRSAQQCHHGCGAAADGAQPGCSRQQHKVSHGCQSPEDGLPPNNGSCNSSGWQVPCSSPHSISWPTGDQQLQHQQLAPGTNSQTSAELGSKVMAVSQGNETLLGQRPKQQVQQGELLAAVQQSVQQQGVSVGVVNPQPHQADHGVDDLQQEEAAPAAVEAAQPAVPASEDLFQSPAAEVVCFSAAPQAGASEARSEAAAVAAAEPVQPGGVYNRFTRRAGIHQPLQQDCWRDWDVMAGSLHDSADGFGAWAASHDR